MKITDVIFESPAAPVDSSTTKSPALGAVLKQAYAKYPSAESDIEAYIRQDMDHQQDTDQNLGAQSNINSKQSKYIDRLQDVSRKQNSKIKSLDQENDEQEAELEKLGRELDALEKGTDLPGGRDETPSDKKSNEKPTAQPSSGSVGSSAWAAMPPSATDAKPAPTSTAGALPAPAPAPAEPDNQMALPFEPSGNVLEPAIPRPQQNPQFSNAQQNATDVQAKYYRDLTSQIAKDTIVDPEKASQTHRVHEGDNKEKAEPPEADYGDDYQDMVKRVKKLAGLGPLKTVWDPQKRVYKNVPTAEQPKK